MTLGGAVDVTNVDRLSTSDQQLVLDLASAAERHDGTPPLNDQVRLDLAAGSASQREHLIVRDLDGGSIVGYAHLDTRSEHADTAHLVVFPDQRRRGIGRALIDALAHASTKPDVRAWAHGDLSEAKSLATALGWERVRELRQMRLSVDTPVAAPAYPTDVNIRAFEPGRDEEAWVEVNAAAFRDHPEQGRLDIDDLAQRLAQPWFDAAGFFVAERGDHMLGSHWTKVHVDESGRPTVGEVYVVGIHPHAQGLGLGKALTLIGVNHLRQLGLDVILYVDADNEPAVALYKRLGFVITTVDVVYAQPHQA